MNKENKKLLNELKAKNEALKAENESLREEIANHVCE